MSLGFRPDEASAADSTQSIRAARRSDVEGKHRRVADFLQSHRYDALLLQKPGNFAWLTSGADNTRRGGPETTAALFLTPSARVVVTNNIDSVELFESELPELGFQLKQRAWHESHRQLVQDLCRGRIVASDTGLPGTKDVSGHLGEMRRTLTELEIARMRELGRRVVHSIEATARNCRHQRTEADLAGEVAHRLMKRRVIPVRIQVAGDGRAERFRHWSYGKEPVRRFATISAVGRWHGLTLGATRTFCFNQPPEHLRESHNRAVLMLATGAAFSKHDWELCEVWKRVRRIYEKFGVADEWQMERQAEVTGYELTEVPLVPKSEFRLTAGMPVFWHPSVGPALTGDTFLVGESHFELLTPTEQWPTLTVNVKGMPIACPDLHIRKRRSEDDEFETAGDEAADSVLDHISDESGSEYDLSAIFAE